MWYRNQSPDTLHKLYLHVWANAFGTRQSAYNRQKQQFGDRDFHFASDADLGGFANFAFRIDGQPAASTYWQGHPDVLVFQLDRPLLPGDSLVMQTPFLLNIPASFSRLGHIGESYQMTQWYPKPAVYDAAGWHPMPYLDLGEYYGEFATYDVRITLPENYTVAATGVLQNTEERERLRKLAEETDAYILSDSFGRQADDHYFPPSAAQKKTLHYRAENVHDFAWFADKRFRVRYSYVILPSGKKVDLWAFFTKVEEELWKWSTQYLSNALRFFQEEVGPYPYPHLTAVQSALSAGAGMEYPMITVIGLAGQGRYLDQVIAHEVGHNWFYGILGFNERAHPWLDEGLTSFFEHRYMAQLYDPSALSNFLLQKTHWSPNEWAYTHLARRHQDIAPDQLYRPFQPIQYWLGAYENPALSYRYLRSYLGESTFDTLLQRFYREWSFRHPQPADFRQHFEDHTDQPLHWFFDGLIGSNTRIDYRLRKVEQQGDTLFVQLENKGDLPGPLPLVYDSAGEKYTQWVPGFLGRQSIAVPANTNRVQLDPDRVTLDVDRRQHSWSRNADYPGRRLRLLPGPNDDVRNQFFLTPFAGYNAYDGGLLGVALYNSVFPQRTWEWGLIPLWSTRQNTLTGAAQIQGAFYAATDRWREWRFRLGGRRFHWTDTPVSADYWRWSANLRHSAYRLDNPNLRQAWAWTLSQVSQQFPEAGDPTPTDQRLSLWHSRISWRRERAGGLFPGATAIGLSWSSLFPGPERAHFVQLDATRQQDLYFDAGKRFTYRIFGGIFLYRDPFPGSSALPNAWDISVRGSNDWQFSDWYFGRSDARGGWNQQVYLQEGRFKTPLPTGVVGRSNHWLIALNLTTDLPVFHLPVRPYLDLALLDPIPESNALVDDPVAFFWSSGISVSLWEERIGIYFPIWQGQRIRKAQRLLPGGYAQRIGFTLALSRMHPWDVRESFTP